MLCLPIRFERPRAGREQDWEGEGDANGAASYSDRVYICTAADNSSTTSTSTSTTVYCYSISCLSFFLADFGSDRRLWILAFTARSNALHHRPVARAHRIATPVASRPGSIRGREREVGRGAGAVVPFRLFIPPGSCSCPPSLVPSALLPFRSPLSLCSAVQ